MGTDARWVQDQIRRQHTDFFSTAMNKQEARCDNLIEATAAALNEDAVAFMLVAVQKDNLGLCVNYGQVFT